MGCEVNIRGHWWRYRSFIDWESGDGLAFLWWLPDFKFRTHWSGGLLGQRGDVKL